VPTFSHENIPRFLACKAEMYDTSLAVFLRFPTVTHEPGLSAVYENRSTAIR
jgi:hypothetical protein